MVREEPSRELQLFSDSYFKSLKGSFYRDRIYAKLDLYRLAAGIVVETIPLLKFERRSL